MIYRVDAVKELISTSDYSLSLSLVLSGWCVVITVEWQCSYPMHEPGIVEGAIRWDHGEVQRKGQANPCSYLIKLIPQLGAHEDRSKLANSRT